jgi:anti-sigma B factor antagonist
MDAHTESDEDSEAELEFRSVLSGHLETTVVAAVGDFDLCNAADFKAKLLRALARGPLVLDLERTTFMDSAILQVLVAVHRRAGLLGTTFCLANVTRSTARCLEVTGLDAYLSIHPTVEDAIRAVGTQSGVAGDRKAVGTRP